MIMVQQFHSIHEIDPEFVTSLEALLQEEFPSFDAIIERHDRAPDTDVFIYYLFFGPTQNAPIGFAQASLRKIPYTDLIPWWRKYLFFWDKSYKHWKQVIWKVADGNSGYFVFDPKFSRSIKEKVLSLYKDLEVRTDIQAQHTYYLKGLQDFTSSWKTEAKTSESYVLEPLMKSHKTYEEYLNSLSPEVSELIKKSWKSLHRENAVNLGDYPNVDEAPPYLALTEELRAKCKKLSAQILTFEKNRRVLGCLLVMKGKGGNVFIEPLPFEPEEVSTVSDDLHIQYALLKFFDMKDARKCHVMRGGAKLVFEEREDLKFFQEQGFQHKTVTRYFSSRLPKLLNPV